MFEAQGYDSIAETTFGYSADHDVMGCRDDDPTTSSPALEPRPQAWDQTATTRPENHIGDIEHAPERWSPYD